jgi:hypothetical protein
MTIENYEGCIAIIHPDHLGLWTVDLFDNNGLFVKNIGGSYPKSNSCRIDAQITWSRNIPILVSEYITIHDNEIWLHSIDRKV